MSTYDNMLAQGAAMLDAARRLVLDESVTYSRGPESVALGMTFTKCNLEFMNADGMAVEWTGEDGLIFASDLKFDDDVVFLPARGDLILRTLPDTTTATYEVLQPTGNMGCWHYSDSQRVNMRIHLKQRGN